jgi:hypothetical protein
MNALARVLHDSNEAKDVFAGARMIEVGDLSHKQSRYMLGDMGKVTFDPSGKQEFNIAWFARNGSWIQIIRLQRGENGKWYQGFQIYRNNSGGTEETVCEQIDDGFRGTPFSPLSHRSCSPSQPKQR